MKFYFSQIDDLFSKILSNTIRGVLLYGPDKGYISKICQLIIKKLDLIQTNLSYKDITPGGLSIALNAQNFFAKRELIKITDTTASIDKNLSLILENNFYHFVTFIADELPQNSSIRKLFENSKSLACLACYYDTEQNIRNIVLKKCQEHNKHINNDALEYIASNLKGDHKLVTNELEKLLSFIAEKNAITLTDVQNIISITTLANSDELCIYFAQKKTTLFLQELDKLLLQGINIVLIIRALLRFYINLYVVCNQIQTGTPLNLAIKSLSPPILFKYINDFTLIAKNITLSNIIKTIDILQQAEVKYKTQPDSFELYQELIIIN